MNFPDPKWLEILKASGWQTGALALACGLFLFAGYAGWLPPLAPWMVQLVAFCLLVFGFLAIASTISALFRFFPAHDWIIHSINLRREQASVRKYIPHMTEQERAIIAFLLAKNQKMFTVESTGGYAVSLISRGIVVRALQPGQAFTLINMPVAVPDHVWDVLVENKDKFPYTPPPRGQRETNPWRVPWMAS